MPYIADALHALAANGYKLTQPRRLVAEVLATATQPLSPYDIQNRLAAKDQRLDHVTIYRVLALLAKLGLAHRVYSTSGYVRCQLASDAGCHHYLICRSCGSLREFADAALCAEADHAASRLGFHIEHHFTEVSGLCAACRTNDGVAVVHGEERHGV